MPRAIIGIGGNLGARRAIFSCAEALLASASGCTVFARSKLYESAPIGPPQPDYLNAAFAVDWEDDPSSLFRLLLSVEQRLGRERRERWGPRTLDLDLLYWSEGAVRTDELTVPHAELLHRSFALAPLLDVAPELSDLYAPALLALGGPPSLAQPGWLLPGEPGYALHLAPAELSTRAVLLVGTVQQCGELT